MEVYNGDICISNTSNGFRDDSRGEKNIILRFDKSGNFLNKIGHPGRGDNMYFFYANSYLDSIAYIFSTPNFCVNKYTLSGEFISKDTIASLDDFKQGVWFNDGYIANIASYFPDEDNMLLFYNEKGDIISKGVLLKTKSEPHYGTKPSFTKYKTSLLYRNEYKDTIYKISDNGTILPLLFVDYGEERRNNKENFLKTYSWDEYLEKSQGNNHLYYESDYYCLLQISEYGKDTKFRTVLRFALKNKIFGHVSFIDFNKENTIFKDAVQFLEDKRLYFLVQARYIKQIPDWMKPYFRNLEILDKIKQDDNDLVFIFNLK